MAEDNPIISVDFLKQNYPKITKFIKDGDLEKVVVELESQLITTKSALEFVSRDTLLAAKNVSGLFVEIVKPYGGKSLCCRSLIYC